MIKPGLTEILINAEPSINEIVERTYPSEPSMYEPVAELMSSILDQSRTEDNPGVKVEITHGKYYLSNYAPDITVMIDGLTTPDSSSVYTVLEKAAR